MVLVPLFFVSACLSPPGDDAPPPASFLVASGGSQLVQTLTESVPQARYRAWGRPSALVTARDHAFLLSDPGGGQGPRIEILRQPNQMLLTMASPLLAAGLAEGGLAGAALRQGTQDLVFTLSGRPELWCLDGQGEMSRLMDLPSHSVSALEPFGDGLLALDGSAGRVFLLEGPRLEGTRSIETSSGASEVATHFDARRAYLLNPISDTVEVLDLAEGRVLVTRPVAQGAVDIAFSASTNCLIVASKTRGTLAFYDPAGPSSRGEVVLARRGLGETAPLAGRIRLSRDGRLAHVLVPGRARIMTVDLSTREVIAEQGTPADPVDFDLLEQNRP